MPCRVDDDAERIYNAQLQEKKLKDHLNKVTALLCAVTMEFESSNPSVFHGLLVKNKELADWVKQHKAADEERWFQHYAHQHPKFNKQEIVKMIREGILPIP